MTRKEIEKKLKEIKPFLKKEYNVKTLGLFGSYSDETQSEENDIDILVELEKPIGWKFFSLEIYLEKLFDKKVDLLTKNSIKQQLKEIILNQVRYV
jgi:predicted nucleotidyltransferase